ncbi:MAG: OmpH family outer membrane protein [Bacteroidaceae bacterium]|nr:OmpH family outer membrane protein [Bacteroidaceae bacterium]MBR5707499.1 OmpH family outer membrane protein [Bacteroidaceae bacterium]
MKKTIIIALMALLPFGAFAQKFGHINSADIIPLMTEYKSAQAELEELRGQFTEELNYMDTEYGKKYEDYEKNRETLPESIRNRREQELMESQQKMQQYYQDCQIKLEQKSNELMNTINTKLQKAIQTVGEEGAYVCIFDIAGGVVPFVSSTLTTDVTEAVKGKLGIK